MRAISVVCIRDRVVLFLTIVRYDHVGWCAVEIDDCVDGRCELTARRRKEMMCRVDDGELGEERSAPCVLIGCGPNVGVHLELSARYCVRSRLPNTGVGGLIRQVRKDPCRASS